MNTVPLTDNARTVFMKRYPLKGEDREPIETPEQTMWRVSEHVSRRGKPEADANSIYLAQRFNDELLVPLNFLPNSPTFTGAGTPLGQLAACFVIPLEDDMGGHPDGIFSTLRNAALIQKTGGGNGFSFSRLRPKGALIHSSKGQATGPVGFLRVYNAAFKEISQGGARRGANMAVLRVDHPDIEEFIECKSVEGDIDNFNISVALTEDFMRAVENGTSFNLEFGGKVYKTVDARTLMGKIAQHAWANGEPGALFIDTANASNPVPHLYTLEATNP